MFRNVFKGKCTNKWLYEQKGWKNRRGISTNKPETDIITVVSAHEIILKNIMVCLILLFDEDFSCRSLLFCLYRRKPQQKNKTTTSIQSLFLPHGLSEPKMSDPSPSYHPDAPDPSGKWGTVTTPSSVRYNTRREQQLHRLRHKL